jgi:hypothetical protein
MAFNIVGSNQKIGARGMGADSRKRRRAETLRCRSVLSGNPHGSGLVRQVLYLGGAGLVVDGDVGDGDFRILTPHQSRSEAWFASSRPRNAPNIRLSVLAAAAESGGPTYSGCQKLRMAQLWPNDHDFSQSGSCARSTFPAGDRGFPSSGSCERSGGEPVSWVRSPTANLASTWQQLGCATSPEPHGRPSAT